MYNAPTPEPATKKKEPRKLTRAHVFESLRVGGGIVTAFLGVFVGLPVAIAAYTAIPFGLAVGGFFVFAVAAVISFLIGDRVVTKQNKFYTNVLERMGSGRTSFTPTSWSAWAPGSGPKRK